MRNKPKRQEAIFRLISAGSAANQDTLLGLLRAEGFGCTQATLSRDLREMKVVKIPSDDKGYVYAPASGKQMPAVKSSRINHLADGFLDMQVSGNILVVKTLPGYASTIALAVDNAGIPELLGTIAGDDTIFAVFEENVTKEEVKRVLMKSLPFIRKKI